MKKLNLFFSILGLMLLGSCAEKPVIQGISQRAKWETKARIKNLDQNKTQNLNIDVYAIKNEKARLEVSAMMGVSVASLVMNPTEIQYIIFSQKKFFTGRNSAGAFGELVRLPMHPMNLVSVAFDEPIRGSGWKCSNDSEGLVSQCENKANELKVFWSDRIGGKKNVTISAPHFEMEWHFSSPQTDVQFKTEIFSLKAPPGFKAIQLN